MPTFIQVQVTFPIANNAADHAAGNTAASRAEAVAEKLVQQRLVACTQLLGPIRSHYVWKGKTEHTDEMLLLAKTRPELFDRLVETIRADHPYECPQIVALPILTANHDYWAWLEEQLCSP